MALRRSCAVLAARRSIGRHNFNRAPIVRTKISQPLRVRCRTAVVACKRCRCCAGLSARHFSSSSRADAVGASSVHVGQNGEQTPAAQSESKRAGVGYHMRKGGDGRTRLYWGPDGSTATHRPRRALLVCKPKDIVAACVVRDMAEFLMNKVGVEVVVEPTVREQFGHLASYTSDDIPSLSERVDLLITVGGDGTILYGCTLFAKEVPPLLAFNRGTVGFLTPFDPTEYQQTLRAVVRGGTPVHARKRLDVAVHTTTGEIYRGQAVNDVVVHRGVNPVAVHLKLDLDGLPMQQASLDGVCISTPTGSTGYSLSAGAPLVSPNVEGLMLTPICSATPLVATLLPMSSQLNIAVSSNYVPPRRFSLEYTHTKEAFLSGPSAVTYDSRDAVRTPRAAEADRASWGEEWAQIADGSNATLFDSVATVDVDGKVLCQLKPGDTVVAKRSDWDLPQFTARGPVQDWLFDINEVLFWNRLPKRHENVSSITEDGGVDPLAELGVRGRE